MTHTLKLLDTPTREDLRVFLERLLRAGESEVRITTRGEVLAVYGCTQSPRDLSDPSAVVLVMRAYALAAAPAIAVDALVQARALLDRLARIAPFGVTFEVPDVPAFAVWAGVLPPVSGWIVQGSVDAASLRDVAQEGMRRVADAVPDDAGAPVLQRVRAAVWGTEIAHGVPAAAAFAAESLGFLAPSVREMTLSSSHTWTRLSCAQGHVLVRSR